MSQLGIQSESAVAPATIESGSSASRGYASALVELSKPGIVKLAATSTAIGFLLAALERTWESLPALALTFAACMVGTVLCGAGANALNMVVEHRRDGLMRRTRERPIPSGRLSFVAALIASSLFALAGATILLIGTNTIAALVALATIVSYVLIYTPLKPVTPSATIVGAIPGALPPIIGWTAASQAAFAGLDAPGGWSLFAIIFVWQIPHFLAIAWKYRQDYAAGGYRVLPVVDRSGRRTSRAVLLWSLALIPISLIPAWALPGMFGWLYLAVAFAAGLWMLRASARLVRARTDEAARALFIASIVYLPLVLLAMLADSLITSMS